MRFFAVIVVWTSFKVRLIGILSYFSKIKLKRRHYAPNWKMAPFFFCKFHDFDPKNQRFLKNVIWKVFLRFFWLSALTCVWLLFWKTYELVLQSLKMLGHQDAYNYQNGAIFCQKEHDFYAFYLKKEQFFEKMAPFRIHDG